MRTPIRLSGGTRLVSPLLRISIAAALAAQALAIAPVAASTRPASAPAVHGAGTASVRAESVRPSRPSGPARSYLPNEATCSGGTCDLYAMQGTFALPDGSGSVPIWGYSSTGTTGSAGLPGPTIVATQGTALTINLHNVDLPSATSLSIPGIRMLPDTTGVTSGNAKSYSLSTATLQPGTYLYEAGLTQDGPVQVAMGLYGALVVRPASCATCVYDANSAFNDEALLVLSEIDPSLNRAADPTSVNLSYFSPKYWLINGKSYPDTVPIATDAGREVAIRYVNAGLRHHSMSLLGLSQTIVGNDGRPLANPMVLTDDTIPSGSAVDALVATPASAPANTKIALFEAAMHLDDNGVLSTPPASSPQYTPIAFGGMLTFLTLTGSGGTTGGPVTSAVSASPNPSDGSADVTVTATATASTGANLTAAEFFIDTVGAAGTGTAMTGASGASATITGTIPTSVLATLGSGAHTIYVHAQDTSGWGSVASTVLNLVTTGPVVTNPTVTPSHANGTTSVAYQATASDASGQNVTAAEFRIDGGAASPISMPTPAPDVSLSVTLPAATVAGLSEGSHTLSARAQNALGIWGGWSDVSLTVDKTGPATSGVAATPNPNNGKLGVQIGSTGQLYERIDASVTDPTSGTVNSPIVAAEYFIDTLGANGTGGGMLPTDGVFDSASESVTGAAELFAIAALSAGPHTVYVHGKDAAGNWGPASTTTLVVDKTGPTVTSASLAPNPAAPPTTVTLTATATDPVNGTAAASNVVGAEWFTGADPGAGSGTAITVATPGTTATFTATIPVPTLAIGSTFTISVRARDAAGNWSAVRTASVTIGPLFASGFETTDPAWSVTSGTATITTGTTQAGTRKLSASIAAGASGYVQDNTPANETAYQARFYFNRNGATLPNNTSVTLFRGLTSSSTTAFSVELRRSGTSYQVRAVVSRSGGTTATNWFTIGTGYTAIQVGWTSGTTATFTLRTGGILRQTLAGLNTSAFTLDAVRLGPTGTPAGATGTLLFDSFVSERNNLVIP